MVRSALRAALLCGAVAALATPAFAQDRERLVRIGFSGGAAAPLGDLSTIADPGVAVQGFAQIAPFSAPLTFRVGAFYSRFAGKDNVLLTLPPTPAGSGLVAPQAPVDGTQLIGGLAQARYELSKGSVRPYLIGGAGAFNVRQTFATLQSGGSVDKVRFAIDGGAGFTFNFAGADAFIEARMSNVFGADGVARELTSMRVVPISFGVVF